MGYFSNLWSAFKGAPVVEAQYLPLTPMGRLDALRWHYENDATYDRLAAALQGATDAPLLKGIRPLDNPAHKVVEFYASKLLPRELEDGIQAEAEALKPAIEQIRKWSNWGQRSRVASRWLAMYGNLYIKVASSQDGLRVYRQLIDPRHVTHFQKDDRGYFTFLRLDIPQERTNADGEIEPYTQTEVYDKEKQTYEVYEHEAGAEATMEEVMADGKRIVRQVLNAEGNAQPSEDGKPAPHTGFDFIPVVHVKFRDTGEDLGAAAYSHCLEAIDDLNLSLTRLSKMLFPNIHLVLKANATNRDGIPLDAPQLEAALASSAAAEETVNLGGTKLWRLPGMSDLDSVVPSVDFSAHIDAIEKAQGRIEKLLPELSYYRLRDMQEISGRAARLLLGDVIDRVEEARENLTAGLIRANEMSLTIGKVLSIEGFEGLGEYEEGAFEHSYEEVEVFPISELEEAEAERVKVESAAKKIAAGIITPEEARRDLGIEEGEEGEGGEAPPSVEGNGAQSLPRARQAFDRIGVGGGANPPATPPS